MVISSDYPFGYILILFINLKIKYQSKEAFLL